MRLSAYIGVIVVFWTISVIIITSDHKSSSISFDPYPNSTAAQEKVKNSFKHVWRNYENYAWGYDKLCSLTKSGTNDLGLASMIIESIPTLLLMNLTTEYRTAIEWVENSFHPTGVDSFLSTSSINSKIIAGLISSYELSNNPVFLTHIYRFAKVLKKAMKNNTFFLSFYNLKTQTGNAKKETLFVNMYGQFYGPEFFGLDELGEVLLEFYKLSEHSNDDSYRMASENILLTTFDLYQTSMFPIKIFLTGKNIEVYSISGKNGRFYLSLVKYYIISAEKSPKLREKIEKFIGFILEKLVQQDVSGYFYVGSLKNGKFVPEMDQSACFLPGMLILSVHALEIKSPERILTIAKELAYTCYMMFHLSPSGLSPSTVYIEYGFQYSYFSSNRFTFESSFLESLFYLFYFTNDTIYREWAWNIYLAIENSARNNEGYAEVIYANTKNSEQSGCLGSEFLAKTLQYLFLIFCDSKVLDLKQQVFNAQGHLFTVKKSEDK